MTKYLISFDDGAMTFPEEESPDVADAVRVVREAAKDAGVWVFSAGLTPGAQRRGDRTAQSPTAHTRRARSICLGGLVAADAGPAQRAQACECGRSQEGRATTGERTNT